MKTRYKNPLIRFIEGYTEAMTNLSFERGHFRHGIPQAQSAGQAACAAEHSRRIASQNLVHGVGNVGDDVWHTRGDITNRHLKEEGMKQASAEATNYATINQSIDRWIVTED